MIISEVPMASRVGMPTPRARAGTARNPPPAPTRPTTAPTTAPIPSRSPTQARPGKAAAAGRFPRGASIARPATTITPAKTSSSSLPGRWVARRPPP